MTNLEDRLAELEQRLAAVEAQSARAPRGLIGLWRDVLPLRGARAPACRAQGATARRPSPPGPPDRASREDARGRAAPPGEHLARVDACPVAPSRAEAETPLGTVEVSAWAERVEELPVVAQDARRPARGEASELRRAIQAVLDEARVKGQPTPEPLDYAYSADTAAIRGDAPRGRPLLEQTVRLPSGSGSEKQGSGHDQRHRQEDHRRSGLRVHHRRGRERVLLPSRRRQGTLDFDRLVGGERVAFEIEASPKGPRAVQVRAV